MYKILMIRLNLNEESDFRNLNLIFVRYISIPNLEKMFHQNPTENVEMFFEAFHKNPVNTWEEEEIRNFIDIQNNSSKVFNSWIEQHSDLKELLISNTTKNEFIDRLKWKEHFQFEAFQKYIAPFFLSLLERKLETKANREWANIFSYFILIEEETRFYLEQSLYKKIDEDIENKFQHLKKETKFEVFQSDVTYILSDDILQIHNGLGRSSHALKINFVENVLTLFKHRLCTAKLANWMLIQLDKMKLNEQQSQSLQEIKLAINSGEFTFKYNENAGSSKISLKTVFIIVTIFGIIGIVFFSLTTDFSPPPQIVHEGSALTYFSVNERKEIDSILRSMQPKPILESDTSYYGAGATVFLRTAFENSIVEDLFRDFEKDMEMHYSALFDSSSFIKTSNFSNEIITKTKALLKRKNGRQIEMNNSSEYTILVICWEEKAVGETYSLLVAPHSIQTFLANEQEHFIILPGIGFSKIPSKNRNEFKLLKSHFSNIDFNFEYALQQQFILDSPHGKKTKILLEGKKGDIFQVTDLDGSFKQI